MKSRTFLQCTSLLCYCLFATSVYSQNMTLGLALGGINGVYFYGGEIPLEVGLLYKSQGLTLFAGPAIYKNKTRFQYGGSLLGHIGYANIFKPNHRATIRYGVNLKGFLGWGFNSGFSIGFFLAPGYDFTLKRIQGSHVGVAANLNLR